MSQSAVVGSLTAFLGLDSVQFRRGLQNSRVEMRGFGRELQREFARSAQQSGVLGAALGALGPQGVAAGVGIAALSAAMVKGRAALVFADEIADSATKLKVSTDLLQEYRYVIQQLGGDWRDADTSLEGFRKAYGAALNGISAKALKPFDALDLDPKKLGDWTDALRTVVDLLSRVRDEAQQVDLADRFGLTSFLPAIRAGLPAIDQYRAAAHELGIVMDADVIAKAGEANDKIDALAQVTQGQLNTALVELAPLLLGIAGTMAKTATSAREFVDWISKAAKAAGDWADDKDILAIFEWANKAGAAVGEATHANRLGQTVQRMLDGGDAKPGEAKGKAKAGPAKKAPASGPGLDGPNTVVRNLSDESASAKAAAAAVRARADAERRTAASKQAIAAAASAELSAQISLTQDAQSLADLQMKAVDAATKAENDDLLQAAVDGDITRAAADKAIKLKNSAARLEKQAIQQEAEARLGEEAVAQRTAIAGYYDQIASIQASLASTAEEQNRVELAALAHRQRVEARNLADEQRAARDRAGGDPVKLAGLDSQQAAETAAQNDLHAAERLAQQRDAQVRVEEERSSLAESALQLEIDLLSSQEGLAETAFAQARLRLEMLPLEQQLRRLKLEEIVNSSAASAVEKKIAQAQLDRLGAIEQNETAAAKKEASYLNGIADAADAAAGMIDSFKSGDVGQGIQNLGSTLGDLSGVLGTKSGLGQTLGNLAAKLGPIGSLVSSGLGILGALFGGSNKVIGEVRLSAEDQQALQGVGTVLGSLKAQSQSISDSLTTAETYQNKDLDFASAQVAYLQDISAGLGDLTTALSRDISLSGDAFDTSKLNLGSTGSKGFLGVIGAKNTTTELVDQGVNLGSGSLQDYINRQVEGFYYQDTKSVTTKSGFLGIGGGTKTVNKEYTSELGDDVTSQLGSAFQSIRDAIVGGAEILGVEGTAAIVDAFQIDLGRVSLEGLSAEEISEQLNAVLSKSADQLSSAGIPGLEAFQQAGEGAFETLQRLATEYTTVDSVMTSLGMTFQQVGWDSVAARDRLVELSGGLEEFTSQAQFFSENFLTEAERLKPTQDAVTEAMAELGYAGVTTHQQFADLVQGLDVSTEAGAELYARLMDIAPAFDKVADAAEQSLESARSDALAAFEAEKSRLEGVRDEWRGWADDLSEYARDLTSSTSTDESLAALGSKFDQVAAGLAEGDKEAFETFTDVADRFKSAFDARSQNALDQKRNDAKIRIAAEKGAEVAGEQASLAEQQLAGINATVAALGLVKDSVDTIPEALRVLGESLAAKNTASGGASLGASPTVNALLREATGYTGAFGSGGFQAYIVGATDEQKAAAREILTAFGQEDRIVGFATGGTAQLGGTGGIDSSLARIRMTPGEWLNVSHQDPVASQAESMAALTSRIATLESAMVRTAVNTGKFARAAQGRGLAIRAVDPAQPIEVAVAP